MALVNYDQPSPKYLAVVNNNQPAQSESEPRIKSCSKYIACALVLFASKAAWDAIQPSEPLDNSIKHYETDSEAVIGPSYVIVIFTLLFGACGIFACIAWDKCRNFEKKPEAEKQPIKEKEVSFFCLKGKESAENIKWKKFDVEFYVLPTEIVEGHLIPSCKLKTIGVLGKVSKEWNEFSKHAIVMYFLNKNPAKTLGKLKIYSTIRGIKAVNEYFGFQTKKITHLPEKIWVSEYRLRKKYPNLQNFTLELSIKVTELSPNVTDLKWKTFRTNKNLKVQNVVNLKNLTIDDLDEKYSDARNRVDVEIANLPNLEKISIKFFKINELCFDQCSPSCLCLVYSHISKHNISTLTSLRDLIIDDVDLTACPVTSSSIERVYVEPEKLITSLPSYPLLHTLVIGCDGSNRFRGLIDIESLKVKYPVLKKVMITAESRDICMQVEDYVEEFKPVFERHGIQLVEKNRFLNKYLPQKADDYFTEPELDLSKYRAKKKSKIF